MNRGNIPDAEIGASRSLWDYLAIHPLDDRLESVLSVFYLPEYQSSLTRPMISAAGRINTGPIKPEGSSGEPWR